MTQRTLWLLCAYCCCFSVAGADTPQTKRVTHDPFQRPAIPEASVVNEADLTQALAPPIWAPKLIMTLRAGPNSMANVDGKIIKLGETYHDYKLIEVDERTAVFIKNKQRTQLTIDNNKTSE